MFRLRDSGKAPEAPIICSQFGVSAHNLSEGYSCISFCEERNSKKNYTLVIETLLKDPSKEHGLAYQATAYHFYQALNMEYLVKIDTLCESEPTLEDLRLTHQDLQKKSAFISQKNASTYNNQSCLIELDKVQQFLIELNPHKRTHHQHHATHIYNGRIEELVGRYFEFKVGEKFKRFGAQRKGCVAKAKPQQPQPKSNGKCTIL